MQSRTEELLASLDSAHETLLSAIACVPAALREQRPAENRWSAAEVVEHLAIVEDRIVELLTQQLANPTDTPAQSIPTLTVEALTDRSLKRVASEASQPSGSLVMEEALDALNGVRVGTGEMIRTARDYPVDRVALPHPALGTLDFRTWIVFIAGHQTRHAAQIREIGEMLAGQ